MTITVVGEEFEFCLRESERLTGETDIPGSLAVSLRVLGPAGDGEAPGGEGRHQAQPGDQLATFGLSLGGANLLSQSNISTRGGFICSRQKRKSNFIIIPIL